MADIVKSIINALTSGEDNHSELPMYIQDDVELISDRFNEEYITDEEYIRNCEKEIVDSAYAIAQHNALRDKIYRCDFYKGITPRILLDDYETDTKWRLDVDHPVALLLYELHGNQPIHVCKDYFGDQFIYTTEEIDSAIDTILLLCEKHGYKVWDDPEVEEEQTKENNE